MPKCLQKINETQMNIVLGYIKSGVEEGAKLECGGKRIGDKGWFVEPTVFSEVTDQMKIAREEVKLFHKYRNDLSYRAVFV